MKDNDDLPSRSADSHDRSITIALGADDNYAIGLAVVLSSTIAHLPMDVDLDVHLFDGGLTRPSLSKLRSIAARHPGELLVHPFDARALGEVKIASWGASINYFPLLLPDVVDAGRVICLDADLLVRSSIVGLLDEATAVLSRSRPIAAVPDFGIEQLSGAITRPDEIGLNPTARYLNSGVLVVDVEGMRDRSISESALRFAAKHRDRMRFSDQDALNAALDGSWAELPPGWNVQLGTAPAYLKRQADDLSLRRFIDRGRILHYSGPRKPWRPGYRGPARREYIKELLRSGWFDEDERRAWTRSYIAGTPRAVLGEAARRSRRSAGRAYYRWFRGART